MATTQLAVNQAVYFPAAVDDGTPTTLRGVITRVWDKPKTDPYVTIVYADQSTYVRSGSQVTPAEANTAE